MSPRDRGQHQNSWLRQLFVYILAAATLFFAIAALVYVHEKGPAVQYGSAEQRADRLQRHFTFGDPMVPAQKQGATHGVDRAQGAASVHAAPPRVDLLWHAPFLDASSFGHEATTMLMGLLDAHVLPASQLHVRLLQDSCDDKMASIMEPSAHAMLVQLHAKGPPVHQGLGSDSRDTHEGGSKKRKLRVSICHNMPPYMGRPAAWRACQRCPAPGAYAVGRAMVETDKMLTDWIPALNSMDELWVPTEHSRTVLRASGITQPMHIVPLAVNTSHFDPSKNVPAKLPIGTVVFGTMAKVGAGAPAPFVFVSVFKWERRKGWQSLLEAYLKEFTARDAVQMYIHTKPFGDGVKDVAGYVRSWVAQHLPSLDVSNLPSLHIIQDELTAAQYASMLAASHAMVLPTRGEGWGLPLVEAMAMGKPVIATNWSGPTAYLDEQVGYPLDYSLVPVPDDEVFWFKGSKWADVPVPHLRATMRHVVANPTEAASRGSKARMRMAQDYSPQSVAQVIEQQLRRIADAHA